MTFEVLTEVHIKITGFWDMMPCSLGNRYQHFRETVLVPPSSQKKNLPKDEIRRFSEKGYIYKIASCQTPECHNLN
jgi:hypothetical protein